MNDQSELDSLRARIVELERIAANLKSACLINFKIALIAGTGAIQSARGEKNDSAKRIGEFMEQLYQTLGVTADGAEDDDE